MDMKSMDLIQLDDLINLARTEIINRGNKDKKPVYVISEDCTNYVFKDQQSAIDEYILLLPVNIKFSEPLTLSIRYIGSELYKKQSDEWLEV